MGLITVCLTCGESVSGHDAACASCGAWHRQDIPADGFAIESRDRLLRSIEEAIRSHASLKTARARQLRAETLAQRKRAIQARLEAQAILLAAKIRQEPDPKERALLEYALALLEVELGNHPEV
jgi:hypothetical protein